MADTNKKLASMFQQMADVTEILGGNRFRVNAFARVARVIGELGRDIDAIGPDKKALTDIDGIGDGTADRIIEYLDTGKMDDYDELIGQVPEGLLPMLDISGLGPKTIATLWQDGGIDSVAALKDGLDNRIDELSKLPRIGKKKLASIGKSLAFAQQSSGRAKIGVAMPVAEHFVEHLRQLKSVKQVQYAGSLRRGRETIGDVDIIVAAASKDASKIAESFVKADGVTDVLVQGPTKSSVRTEAGMQVDLRIVPPDRFGAALLYFTGSKEHNVSLRQRAIDRDMRLNEYGLWEGTEARDNSSDEGLAAAKTEEDVYKKLELKWIAPELREDRDEIKLAEQDKLPTLVEMDDIVAELHAHTTASDGVWSIEAFADVAIERGYHTIAITDHSKGQVQANGLDEARLEKHIEAVRKVAKRYEDRITILAGSEVDILADGRLDYPDDLLAELDIVVASPHSALSQDASKATPRLIKALEHPSVTILGHPTGRLIGRREGMSPDIQKLVDAAKANGKALEVNANSWRLDLRDSHARLAVEAGVKLSINTDAHGEGDLRHLQYGVLTARRAGATKDDVVNTMSKAALRKWIESTRG